MWWYKKIFFLLLTLFISGVFFGIGKVLAVTSSAVNVMIVVPGGGGGTGCTSNCNTPTDNAPSISAVSSTVTYNSAMVTWTASDDTAISSVGFVYGLTNSYGQTGNISGAYGVSLTGLTSSTIYYYKITVTDSAAQSAEYTGSFQTSAASPQLDITAPVISNILVNPSQTSAVITFLTNENSTAQAKYGVTTGFGSNSLEGSPASLNHEITLFGLSPSTTYFFQIIATDVALNSASSSVLNFKTLKDTIAPPDVSDLKITTGTSYLSLSWTNPSLSFAPDFSGVKVLRKLGVHSSLPNDTGATEVYNGGGQSHNDSSVVVGNMYYYTVFSYDQSGNYSPGVFVSGKLIQATAEICDNKVDDNNNGKIDCLDDNCINNDVCKPPKVEICDNKIDDDLNGKIDCADSTCIELSSCKIKVQTEICNNNIDDDTNGKTDCADLVCATDINCEIKIPTTTDSAASVSCSDGLDNDADGLVDFPSDPGCTGVSDNDEYNPPENTVPSFEKLTLDKVRFFAGSHQIELFSTGNSIFGLAGSNLSLHIKKSALIGTPESFIFRIGDSEKHQFVLNSKGDTYFADSIFPASGNKQTYLEINYGTNQFDSLGVNLNSVALGQVEDESGQKISGAETKLFQENGDIFPASIFGQVNPVITNNTSQFGWMVPAGRYYLVITKDGFYDYKSPTLVVNNNIFNQSVNLVRVPKKLVDVIDPNASVGENVVNVAKNLAEKTKASTVRAVQQLGDAAKVAQEVAADPAVQQVANTVVAPTAVGVAAVGTVAIVSWADILPLLRFLFLQPVLILGRGKREKWGSVYNSLSKLPVDLALVRLINAETNKILQTKVTSSDGRYFFVVNNGKYRLEARKGNFLFPSNLLKDFQVDGQKSDIYHGEEILVNEKGTVITANIPLDPSGQIIKTPRKLLLVKALRRIQNVVSWLGLIVTAGTLYISPKWYMWVLLAAHLAMTFVFRRLSKAPPAKGWGIVYDENNKKPLGNVVARLFDSKFNKLVATEVTSADGKYYFVAGENQYYISYDRDGYQSQKTEVIDLKGKEIDTVAEDVGLKKKV